LHTGLRVFVTGLRGWFDPGVVIKPIPKNRVEPEVEEAVVQMAFDCPAYGQSRACNELRKKGIFISAAGFRCVWQWRTWKSFLSD
jgi:hypothetical protein